MIKSKKSQSISYELSLIIISLILIGILLYGSSFYLNKSVDELNSIDSIYYEFPSIYVHSFLYLPIKKEDIKDLGLDENKDYIIKDLLYYNTEETNSIINKYRISYIEASNLLSSNDNMHSLFQKFSETEYDVDSDNLLKISYFDSLKPFDSEENYIKSNSYYYYFKTRDNKFAVVEFRRIY